MPVPGGCGYEPQFVMKNIWMSESREFIYTCDRCFRLMRVPVKYDIPNGVPQALCTEGIQLRSSSCLQVTFC